MAQYDAASERVVCLGALGIDMAVFVDAFPLPDSKVASRKAVSCGGGNAANTATALAKLGLRSAVASCVGDDASGTDLLRELEEAGVEVDSIKVTASSSTAFTYVIVDAAEQTRTCIHTPGSCGELGPAPLMMRDAWLLHCDTRHTAAAIAAAIQANAAGVPVSLDVERARPLLDDLLPLAEFLFTDSKLSFVLPLTTGVRAAHAQVLARFPRARFVCSTRGARGALLTARRRFATNYLQDNSKTAHLMIERRHPLRFEKRDNIDDDLVSFSVGAWPLEGPVVDTTGAGDAFIAGFICGMNRRFDIEHCLAAGAFVASRKLLGFGARANLPDRALLDSALRGDI